MTDCCSHPPPLRGDGAPSTVFSYGTEVGHPPSESFYLNSSTLSKGLAAHGRKRLRVNLVFSPGFTFTSR